MEKTYAISSRLGIGAVTVYGLVLYTFSQGGWVNDLTRPASIAASPASLIGTASVSGCGRSSVVDRSTLASVREISKKLIGYCVIHAVFPLAVGTGVGRARHTIRDVRGTRGDPIVTHILKRCEARGDAT